MTEHMFLSVGVRAMHSSAMRLTTAMHIVAMHIVALLPRTHLLSRAGTGADSSIPHHSHERHWLTHSLTHHPDAGPEVVGRLPAACTRT